MNLLHNELEDILKPGTIVAHYKRNDYLKLTPPTEQVENMYLYQVCGIATNTNTNIHMVIYQALYGTREVFARPLEEYLGSSVKTRDGLLKSYTPKFTVYKDPVAVPPASQAAGMVVNEDVTKLHEDKKKLRKKVKNLQSKIKALTKENEQLKKSKTTGVSTQRIESPHTDTDITRVDVNESYPKIALTPHIVNGIQPKSVEAADIADQITKPDSPVLPSVLKDVQRETWNSKLEKKSSEIKK